MRVLVFAVLGLFDSQASMYATKAGHSTTLESTPPFSSFNPRPVLVFACSIMTSVSSRCVGISWSFANNTSRVGHA